MRLTQAPRIHLAHLPTPLEKLERLTKELSGPEIWIKRDDCTGLSTGGNKTRKLEYLMGEALSRQASTVITYGATQSNHARQTAAFAAKMGLACFLVLQNKVGSKEVDYTHNGNVLLDRLHGARVIYCEAGADVREQALALSHRLSTEGHAVYFIPAGGSNVSGSLGYVNCALELFTQANQRGLIIHHLITATGSCGTQAGLAVGVSRLSIMTSLTGISVNSPKSKLERDVCSLAAETASYLDFDVKNMRDNVVVDDNYVGPGYGLAAPTTIEAIQMFAQLEGIVLDPVYSGKAAAGLIDYCRKGYFRRNENVVFLHTGGMATVFAYRSAFADVLREE